MNLIRYSLKRLFCKHKYTLKGRLYTDEYDISLHYECVKCGKQIDIEMDKESQIKENK